MWEFLFLPFNELFYRPIYNFLIVFSLLFFSNLWIWIIVLTLFIRLILLVPNLITSDMQKNMTEIQPKINEIQEKYKDNPEKMMIEMKKIMSEWNFLKKTLMWCFMMLLQIPIFISLFYVILNLSNWLSWKNLVDQMYSFFIILWFNLENFKNVDYVFLWIDLLKSNSLILAILSWLVVYVSIKVMTFVNPKPNMPATWQNIDMSAFMEFLNWMIVLSTIIFVYTMPSAIWLYIITSSLFSIIQTIWQYRLIFKALIWK